MADPLSVLGAALGVTSLVIQVADDCIKAYKYYSEAIGMQDEHNYMQLKFQIERQRFMTFALEIGLLYSPCAIPLNLQVHKSLLLAVLAELKTLLESHAEKHGKFKEIPQADDKAITIVAADLVDVFSSKPLPATTKDKPKILGRARARIVGTGSNLRTIVTEPKRLIWAAVDKQSFEKFLARVEELNSFLIALLDGSQSKRLQEAMNTTYLEILQIRNDVKSLLGLMEALAPKSSSVAASTGADSEDPALLGGLEEDDLDQSNRAYLRRLTKVKIKHKELEAYDSPSEISGSNVRSTANLIQFEEIVFASVDEQPALRPSGSRTQAKYGSQDIWIEWRQSVLKAHGIGQTSAQQTELRLRLLTDLLSSEKPARFCAPPCLGYVRRKSEDLKGHDPEFGIVFRKPDTAPPGSATKTLRDILAEPKPSLTARMELCATLARCLQSFHAVGWLHKGLRSDNVLLFIEQQPDSDLDRREAYQATNAALRNPSITGFDFARPHSLENLTEDPEFVPSHEIYRHPSAQPFYKPRNNRFRQSYDMYSLGIIMLEITFWQPIEKLIGHNDCGELSRLMLQKVKDTILHGDVHPASVGSSGTQAGPKKSETLAEGAGLSMLDRVASECGDAFRDAVETCLRADEIEMEGRTSDKGATIWLQRAMKTDVVERMEVISAALQAL